MCDKGLKVRWPKCSARLKKFAYTDSKEKIREPSLEKKQTLKFLTEEKKLEKIYSNILSFLITDVFSIIVVTVGKPMTMPCYNCENTCIILVSIFSSPQRRRF